MSVIGQQVSPPMERQDRVRVHLLLLWAISLWFLNIELPLGPIAIGISDIIAGLIFLLSFPKILVGRFTTQLYVVIFNLLFLAMSLISILGLLFVFDTGSVLRFMLRYFIVWTLLMSVATYSVTYEDISRIFTAFVITGAIVTLVTVLDYYLGVLGGSTIEQTRNRRAIAFFQQTNQYGIFLACSLPLIATSRLKTFGKFFVVGVYLVGLIFAGSKTNIALSGPVLALMWFARSKISVTSIIGLILVSVVAIFTHTALFELISEIIALFNPDYAEKLFLALSNPAEAETFLQRLHVWELSIYFGAQHPVTGVGAGQAIHFLPYTHSHNFILHYFFTLGVPGTVIILTIALTLLLWPLEPNAKPKVARTHRLIKISSLSFFLGMMMSDSIAGMLIYLLGFLSIVTVAISIAQNEQH